tara:strand:+ start:3602 stop:4891 length:1290 start_codon:yes stop_codon:yes gene_type:complete
MVGALDDIRVLDLSEPLGHYAGYLLANLGADVVKLEPPHGDDSRSWAPFLPDLEEPESSLQFMLLNVGKRGMTLDIYSETGRKVFLQLLNEFDVLLQSWTPQQMESLGLDQDTVRELFPNLINASVTGWGLDGPYASFAYSDIVSLAMAGVMNLSGFQEGPPTQLPDQQGFHCASINLAAGVVAAILERDASGIAQDVEVSMHESLLMAEETAMQSADIRGIDRERTGAAPGLQVIKLPGMGLYATQDGWVYAMAAGIAGSGFNGLLALMDLLNDSIADDLREEPYASVMAEFSNSAAVFRLLGDPERMNEVKETFAQVDELVTGFFQKYPKEELYVEGQKLRLLIGTVNGPQELSESEQLNDRDWFRTINDTGRGRELRYPGPPWQLKATPATLSRPAPLLGEHNEEVFRAIGLGKSEIMEMSESGVI